MTNQTPEVVLLAGEEWKAAMVPKLLDSTEILKWGELHVEKITESINDKGTFVPGLVILGSPPDAKGMTVQLALPILKYIAPKRPEDAPTMAGELTRIVVTTLLEAEGYAVMVALPAFVPENAEAAKNLGPGGAYEDDDEIVEALVVTVETMEGMVSMRMFVIDRDEDTNQASISVELEMNDFQKKLFPRFLETAVQYAKEQATK